MKPILHSVALVLGLGLTSLASAQSTWTMTSGCSQNGGNSNNFGNTYNCGAAAGGNSGASTATVSAWSTGRDGTGQPTSTYALTGSGWASAYVSDNGGSGFGTVSRQEANADNPNLAGTQAIGLNVGSPNHSVDSVAPGNYDLVMLQFNVPVVLSQFAIGWSGGDSDMTIMRWSGAAAPTTTAGTVTGGGSNANLTDTIGAGGWQLVGNYSDVVTNSATNTGATLASSYWLVAAYNTYMGGDVGWSTGNDSFKLDFLKAAAYTCPGGGAPGVGGACAGNNRTPTPGSLALLAAAGLGVGFVRRRRIL